MVVFGTGSWCNISSGISEVLEKTNLVDLVGSKNRCVNIGKHHTTSHYSISVREIDKRLVIHNPLESATSEEAPHPNAEFRIYFVSCLNNTSRRSNSLKMFNSTILGVITSFDYALAEVDNIPEHAFSWAVVSKTVLSAVRTCWLMHFSMIFLSC